MDSARHADDGRRRAAQRLFADDRFAGLSRFRADPGGDARPDPEGGRGDRLLPQQGGLEPRVAPLRGPSASSCRRCRTPIYLPFVEGARQVFERDRADYVLQTIDYARGREAHGIGALLSQRVQAILLPSIGHTPETEAAEVAADPSDRGRQPAETADPFRRRPFRFRCRLSGHARLIDSGRRRIAIICGYVAHVERPRPAGRISQGAVGGGAGLRRERVSRRSNMPSTPGLPGWRA